MESALSDLTYMSRSFGCSAVVLSAASTTVPLPETPLTAPPEIRPFS